MHAPAPSGAALLQVIDTESLLSEARLLCASRSADLEAAQQELQRVRGDSSASGAEMEALRAELAQAREQLARCGGEATRHAGTASPGCCGAAGAG